jgi:hypothetical protein
MPNMPKPNPFASNIKKADPASYAKKMPPANYKASMKKMPPNKLKAILALLTKMGGAPRGESPMPYSRFGQPMD